MKTYTQHPAIKYLLPELQSKISIMDRMIHDICTNHTRGREEKNLAYYQRHKFYEALENHVTEPDPKIVFCACFKVFIFFRSYIKTHDSHIANMAEMVWQLVNINSRYYKP